MQPLPVTSMSLPDGGPSSRAARQRVGDRKLDPCPRNTSSKLEDVLDRQRRVIRKLLVLVDRRPFRRCGQALSRQVVGACADYPRCTMGSLPKTPMEARHRCAFCRHWSATQRRRTYRPGADLGHQASMLPFCMATIPVCRPNAQRVPGMRGGWRMGQGHHMQTGILRQVQYGCPISASR